MRPWTLFFVIVALASAVVTFTDIFPAAAGAAKIVLEISAALAVISFILGRIGAGRRGAGGCWLSGSACGGERGGAITPGGTDASVCKP